MARAGSRQAKKKAGKATAKRKWDRVNLKVTWPQPKQAVSIRVDEDILAWFRDGGPRYQTRMNAVLRTFVDAQQRKRST